MKADRAGVDMSAAGLEVLDAAESLRLLGGADLGRIAITVHAMPVVVPVHFTVVDREIVFRVRRGSKLDAATDDAVVAFEVDDFDGEAGTGWSVVVTGRAGAIDGTLGDAGALAAVVASGIPRWADDAAGRLVRITPWMVSGRRIQMAGVS